jgi:hypothetical protein
MADGTACVAFAGRDAALGKEHNGVLLRRRLGSATPQTTWWLLISSVLDVVRLRASWVAFFVAIRAFRLPVGTGVADPEENPHATWGLLAWI